MTMANIRLPSGIYMDMVAAAASEEAHFVPEYPIFQSPRGIGGDRSPSGGSLTPTMLHARQKNEHLEHKDPLTGHPAVDRGLLQPQSRTPQPEVCLPLVSVSIDMQVDCNIAKTKLVQTFTNHGGISIPEAWYSFPLYDGATVTAFRCEVGEDKVLEGKVKPKGEAKDEFRRAVKKQEAAALIEELTPDVFQTSIGNIKPSSTVRVEITYVEELHNDLGGNGIVVTIPTSVAPRYGTPPAGYTANSTAKNTGLSLVVSVVTPGPTKEIVCRSGHGISIEYGKMNHTPEAASFGALAELPNPDDCELSLKHATIRLSHSHAVMDRDFILFIPSFVGGLPKSRAILAPPGGSDHAAMMVTVNPDELFADLEESMDEFDGEILFLADRSGSMAGPKIAELRDALLVFLKSLPANCKFNIYSFGNNVTSLWPRSMPYNEANMQQALNHVSTFAADFGGTKVRKALRKAVRDRLSTGASSTQLILLTDGEIWQADKTIDFVRTTTSEADGQVRFFSLGIGNRVSHQLIQGIGFFGGGFGQAVAVDAHGRWKEAVIHMLKGAVMPNSWSYTIQFGEGWNEKRLDLDDFLPYHAERNSPEALRQLAGAADRSFVRAPRTIPLLHHFGHQSVYFLLHSTSDHHLPECVTITACSQYGGTKTATLAVTKGTTNNIMQHLAAKAAVRDLETQDTVEASSARIRKNAERLCQMYSITSKWTSFVAVSHLQTSAEYEDVEISLYKAPLAELDLMIQPGFSQIRATRPAPAPARPRIEECLTSYSGMSSRRDEITSDARGNETTMSICDDARDGSSQTLASQSFSIPSFRCFPDGSSSSHVNLRSPLSPPRFFSADTSALHLHSVGRRREESYNENFGGRSGSGDGISMPYNVPYGKTGSDDIYSYYASHSPSESRDRCPDFHVQDPSKVLSEQPVPRDETEERSRREQDLDDSDVFKATLPRLDVCVYEFEESVGDDEPGGISPMDRCELRSAVDTTALSRKPSPATSANAFGLARARALDISKPRSDNAELNRTTPITRRLSQWVESSASRPNGAVGSMPPKEQLKAKEGSDKGSERSAMDLYTFIDPYDCVVQTSACAYPPQANYNNLYQPGSGTPEINSLELIRCQRADGLFDIEHSLEDRIAPHFCYGMRQALRRLMVNHRNKSITYTDDRSVTTELLVDTVIALAYIRSHLYSQRALWDLLVRKAERRLASHFNSRQWDRPDGVSAIAESALLHAHYGDGSQKYEGDSGRKLSPNRGHCGVCNSQDGKSLLSGQNDSRPATCTFPDCDFFLGDRDEFWAHAFEQDHILSSCENARDRYTEAAAKALKADACREGEDPESIESKENQEQSTIFRGTKRTRTPTEHDAEVAGGHKRCFTKRG